MPSKNASECVRLRRSARRLGQDEQYLTVREILSESSTPVPPKAGLSRERSVFTGLSMQDQGLLIRSSRLHYGRKTFGGNH